MTRVLGLDGSHEWVNHSSALPVLSIHGRRSPEALQVSGGGAGEASGDVAPADPEPGGGVEFVSAPELALQFASDPALWTNIHFAAPALNHLRRVRRLQTIALAMAASPGLSLPQLFPQWYGLKAAYQLFDHPEATPDAFQVSHRQQTRHALGQPGEYLLIEDTSVVSYSGRLPIEGLGAVGHSSEGQTGFALHSVLAVRWPDAAPALEATERRPALEVVGLLDQQYDIRTPHPPAIDPRTGKTRRRPLKKVLSPEDWGVWERATDRVGPAPRDAAVRWVRVADREADIYEYLCGCLEQGHGFIVRASQDRAVVGTATEDAACYVFGALSSLPMLGKLHLEIPARAGKARRVAALTITAGTMTLKGPRRLGARTKWPKELTVTVVRAFEAEPPAGVERLEWVLYHDRGVRTLSEAVDCVRKYAGRWIIEEYHKALKTGMGAERLQLESASRLYAAVAVMSVVAVRLLSLKEWARIAAEAPASAAGLSELEWVQPVWLGDRPNLIRRQLDTVQ